MKMFLFNMDRKNDTLCKSLEDLLIKKQAIPGFGAVSAKVTAKNNGFYLEDMTDDDVKIVWSSIKMISQGCSASYWITDYGPEFKFITLRRKSDENHQFKHFPAKEVKREKMISKKIEVTEDVANDLQSAMSSGPKHSPKKEFKKIEKLKLDDLTPSEELTLEVKFNPDKPFSMATVNGERKLIKIPDGSWIKITGNKFQTNNDEVKGILIGKGFEYEEDVPTAE